MNALISFSVFKKMNDYTGPFFLLLHTLHFLCLDGLDLLEIVLPQSSQV